MFLHRDLTVNIKTACTYSSIFTEYSVRCSKLTDRMPEGDSAGESIHGKPSAIGNFFKRLGQVWLSQMTIRVTLRSQVSVLDNQNYSFSLFEMQIYQSWLDKSTPFSSVRWASTLILTAIYMIRVYILQVKPCFTSVKDLL